MPPRATLRIRAPTATLTAAAASAAAPPGAAGARRGAPPRAVAMAAAMTVAAVNAGVVTRRSAPAPPGLAGLSALETGRIAPRLRGGGITRAVHARGRAG